MKKEKSKNGINTEQHNSEKEDTRLEVRSTRLSSGVEHARMHCSRGTIAARNQRKFVENDFSTSLESKAKR